MTDSFDGPSSSSGIDLDEINGRLLLITPHKHEVDVSTKLGNKDAIRADVVVLDGAGSPEEHRDILLFPRVLIGQVKSNVATGRSNLGRLGKGEAKPGQSAPWKLADPTETDKNLARAYLAKNTEPPF